MASPGFAASQKSGLGIWVFPRESFNFVFRANGVRSPVPKIKKVRTLASPTPGVEWVLAKLSVQSALGGEGFGAVFFPDFFHKKWKSSPFSAVSSPHKDRVEPSETSFPGGEICSKNREIILLVLLTTQ